MLKETLCKAGFDTETVISQHSFLLAEYKNNAAVILQLKEKTALLVVQ